MALGATSQVFHERTHNSFTWSYINVLLTFSSCIASTLCFLFYLILFVYFIIGGWGGGVREIRMIMWMGKAASGGGAVSVLEISLVAVDGSRIFVLLNVLIGYCK